MSVQVWTHCNAATMAPGADQPYGLVENAALVGRNYVEAAQENLRGEVLAMSTDLNGAQSRRLQETPYYRKRSVERVPHKWLAPEAALQ